MPRSLIQFAYEAIFTETNTGKQYSSSQKLTQKEIEEMNSQLAARGISDRWIAETPSRNQIEDAINSIDWNA